MESLYEEFTTKLLPTIQEGLVITKEYFIDLFGRFIKYLIITDILSIVFGVILLTVTFFVVKKLVKGAKHAVEEDLDPFGWIIGAICVVMAGVGVGMVMTVLSTLDLVKSIYIPEVRIYEEIKSYGINNND